MIITVILVISTRGILGVLASFCDTGLNRKQTPITNTGPSNLSSLQDCFQQGMSYPGGDMRFIEAVESPCKCMEHCLYTIGCVKITFIDLEVIAGNNVIPAGRCYLKIENGRDQIVNPKTTSATVDCCE